MATNVVRLALDLSKWPSDEPVVVVRQGERGSTTIVATVTDQGEEADLSGLTGYLMAQLPGGAALEEDVDEVSGSTITHTVSERATQAPGRARVAYFALHGADGSVITTSGFYLVVLPDNCLDGGAVAKAYVSRIEQLMKQFRKEFDAAEEAREEPFDEKVAAADAATKRANDAADAVNDAISGQLEPLFGNFLDGLNITADEVQQWWDEWEGDADGE